MNRIISTTILAAFAWVAFGPPAAALEEHNPLDALEEAKACKLEKLDPGSSTPNSASLRLTRNEVLNAAIGKNGLPPPESLTQRGSYIDLLADVMVPCSKTAKPGPDRSPADILKHRKDACEKSLEIQQKSESTRYGTDAVRAIRQNLLRLFQSASIGGSRNLIVARRITSSDSAHPWDVSEGNSEDNPQKGYEPLQSRNEDDLMILKYLYAEDGSEPFQVFCKKREFKTDSGTSTVQFARVELPEELNKAHLVTHAAPNAGALWTHIVSAVEEKKFGKKIEFSYPRESHPLTTFEQNIIRRTNTEATKEAITWDVERGKMFQLVLAKDPQEFVKTEREGAQFGTSLPRSGDDDKLVNSGDLELTADASLGFHFRWTDTITGKTDRKDNGPKYKGSQVWAITPYASINQTTQKLTFYEPPTFAAETKKFAYAKLAAGIRLDFKNTLPPKPVKGSKLSNAFEIQKAGLPEAGLGAGLYLEYINDNYNIVSARRIGGYISPPAGMFGPYLGAFYQKSFPLDALLENRSPVEGKKSYTLGDDFLSGWFIKWNAVGVAEDLDYSRLPRNFGPIPDPDKPAFVCWPLQCKEAVVSGAVYGADFSISIERYGLLSLGKEDLFASFTAKLKNRRELQGGNSSDLWDLSLKFQDPTSEKSRYWQIKYLIGEDYVANKKEDQLSFGLVFTN